MLYAVALLHDSMLIEPSLSSSRFLKTILARHAHGPLVLKIFIKPDAAMSLRVIQRRLKGASRGMDGGGVMLIGIARSGERRFIGSTQREHVSSLCGD
jgi:hypothetical protein